MYAADLYTPHVAPITQTSINTAQNRHDMRVTLVKCGSSLRCATCAGGGAGVGARGACGARASLRPIPPCYNWAYVGFHKG
jgi:hypothetical protein